MTSFSTVWPAASCTVSADLALADLDGQLLLAGGQDDLGLAVIGRRAGTAGIVDDDRRAIVDVGALGGRGRTISVPALSTKTGSAPSPASIVTGCSTAASPRRRARCSRPARACPCRRCIRWRRARPWMPSGLGLVDLPGIAGIVRAACRPRRMTTLGTKLNSGAAGSGCRRRFGPARRGVRRSGAGSARGDGLGQRFLQRRRLSTPA